jgi:hypothetical protein
MSKKEIKRNLSPMKVTSKLDYAKILNKVIHLVGTPKADF